VREQIEANSGLQGHRPLEGKEFAKHESEIGLRNWSLCVHVRIIAYSIAAKCPLLPAGNRLSLRRLWAKLEHLDSDAERNVGGMSQSGFYVNFPGRSAGRI
jgi:hypothetical protein